MADASERARIVHRVIRLREGGLGQLSLVDIENTVNGLPEQSAGDHQIIGGQDTHPLAGVLRALNDVEDKDAVDEILAMDHAALMEEWSRCTAEHNTAENKTAFNKAVKSQNKDLAEAKQAAEQMEETGDWNRGSLNV